MIFVKELIAEDEEIGIVETNEGAEQVAKATWQDQLTGMLPLLCIFLVFYVFILRPQGKKLKERTKMINELKVGDKIKTSGGMIVTIKKILEDGNLLAEIANGVEASFSKDAIVSKL